MTDLKKTKETNLDYTTIPAPFATFLSSDLSSLLGNGVGIRMKLLSH